jgi:hypothetical protein
MKTIDTLVEDIYSLFSLDPIDMDEKEVDKHIDTFGEMLKVHIKEFMYEKPRSYGNLRLSQIGKPDRQLWYDVNTKRDAVPLTASTRIKFLYGYILEELLLLCASISGHKVEDQQKEVEVEGVKGHQDSMIDGVLVDCKSASSSSFKSTGEICLSKVHSMEMINAKERVKHLKQMVERDSIPDRCYSPVPDGKSGNLKLPFGCVYCGHKRECWSDVNQGKGIRVFQYAKGKRYLVQVGKEPDVQEVTNW